MGCPSCWIIVKPYILSITMTLDLASFAFGFDLVEGTGTPPWGTSFGQQSPDYKFVRDGYQEIITGIAGSKDFTVVALYKNMMSSERGFVRRILGILDDYNIAFEHLPSGIDTVSVVMANDQINGRLEELLEEFKSRLRPDSIDVIEDIALIATVGHGMSARTGTAAKLFTALANRGVNIRMIDQGSSELNIIVGVDNSNFNEAIKAIYGAFVNKEV